MCTSSKSCCKPSHLDTLEQLATNNGFSEELPINKSTGIKDIKALRNRAKRKFLQLPLVFGLINLIEHYEELLLSSADTYTSQQIKDLEYYQANKKRFWNMYHCAKQVVVDQDKVRSKYCKSRLCIICNSIRQADIINKYELVVNSWKEGPQFLTLTIKSVSGPKLRTAIQSMQKIVTAFRKRLNKRVERELAKRLKFCQSEEEEQAVRADVDNTLRFMGFRTIESNYNARTNEYNPHFHIIVRHEMHAEELLDYWQKTAPLKGWRLEKGGQDIKPVTEGSLIEICKYFTKLTAKLPKGELKPGEPTRAVYLESVLTIFDAFYRIRAFQNFGFKISDFDIEEGHQAPSLTTGENEEEELEPLDPPTIGIYEYNEQIGDWFSTITGEPLTGHEASESLTKVAKNVRYPKDYYK